MLFHQRQFESCLDWKHPVFAIEESELRHLMLCLSPSSIIDRLWKTKKKAQTHDAFSLVDVRKRTYTCQKSETNDTHLSNWAGMV